jgi:hypothetical protein
MTDLNGAAPQQPMQPMFIPPSGLPLTVQVSQVPGHKVVQLTMHTPAGINYYFLDIDAATKIADDIRQHASMARTGLVLPPSGP